MSFSGRATSQISCSRWFAFWSGLSSCYGNNDIHRTNSLPARISTCLSMATRPLVITSPFMPTNRYQIANTRLSLRLSTAQTDPWSCSTMLSTRESRLPFVCSATKYFIRYDPDPDVVASPSRRPAIIGGALGGVFFVIFLLLGLLYLRRRAGQASAQNDTATGQLETVQIGTSNKQTPPASPALPDNVHNILLPNSSSASSSLPPQSFEPHPSVPTLHTQYTNPMIQAPITVALIREDIDRRIRDREGDIARLEAQRNELERREGLSATARASLDASLVEQMQAHARDLEMLRAQLLWNQGMSPPQYLPQPAE
jgi:hypothetical protein